MIRDGMMDRFGIGKVFGMHNMPGLPVGRFAIRPGPIMAATAEFTIAVRGRGGHAAQPHRTIDPIVAASQLVVALQTIVSRTTDPVDSLVVTVTKFHGGEAYNVIPEHAEIAGTVRSLRPEVGKAAEQRMRAICDGVAATFGVTIALDYQPNYPVTVNDPEESGFAADIAADIAGDPHVDRRTPPLLGGEDFSYMLETRPGAFIFIGNGETANLHHPAYDFNDEIIPHGVSYWVKLAEASLAG
jgi:hippurate hydrolase